VFSTFYTLQFVCYTSKYVTTSTLEFASNLNLKQFFSSNQKAANTANADKFNIDELESVS